jgi:hypothetical protein
MKHHAGKPPQVPLRFTGPRGLRAWSVPLWGAWLASLLWIVPAKAATIVWTNLAGGNWNVAANWLPNLVPGSNDVAVITNAGTYTVALNASATIAGFVLGGDSGTQALAHAANTLTLNGPGTISANGRYDFSGGTFTGTNLMAHAGVLNWSGGTIGANAAIAVATNGVVNLQGANLKTLNGAITNAGTVSWTGTGALRPVGVVHNLADGLFHLQTSALLDLVSGSPVFVNEGTIRKTASTGDTDWQVTLINSGTVDTQTGGINFPSGSAFNDGTRFTGTGTNRLAAGTVTLNGEIVSGNLLLAGANCAGNWSLDGALAWTSGTIAAGGALTVPAGSAVTLSGALIKVVTGALTNAGTLTWTDAGVFRLVGVFHNLPDGLFHLQTSALLDLVGGSPVFVNEGTIRKTVSSGNTDWQVALMNSGTVDVQTGRISFPGGSEFASGTRLTGAGTNRLWSGSVALVGEIYSENLELSGATLTGDGSFTGSLFWLSGTIAGSLNLFIPTNGVLLLAGSAIKQISGTVTNAGHIQWQDTGLLRLVGTLHNLESGLFDLRNSTVLDFTGGTPVFVNQGTIRKTLSAGDTSWQVRLVNSGTVDVQAGRISFPGGSEFASGTRLTGAGTNRLWSGSVALVGEIYSENLELSGATLTGDGSFTGSLSWLSGTIAGSLNLFIPTNGVLLLAGSAIKQINGTVTNAGHIQWEGTGWLRLFGTLHNLESGLFDLRNSTVLDFIGGSPLFVNEGIIRKTVSAGNTDWQVALRNSGQVDVQTGRISFPGGSEFNEGSRLTGAGTNRLTTGSVALNGSIYSDNLELSGATLTGAGSFTGTLRWFSGAVSGSLNLFIPTNGLLHLAASGIKTINGTVTNAGVILWEGTGNLRLLGTLHNLPGGLFDVRNNELLDFFGGSPLLINQGRVRKSAGAATSTVQILCQNAGTVEINSGEVYFSGGFTNLAGQVGLGGGALRLGSGQTLDLNGGTLTGAGIVAAHLRNDGLVSPSGSSGVLSVTGDYTQTLGAEVEFELGGTSAGTNHSQLFVTGQANLNGTISVKLAGAYLPNPADAFPVMTFASSSGAFRCFNGFFLLGHDERLSIGYQPTNVTLVAQSAPDPTGAVLNISRDDQVIVCWPREFAGFNLQASTNLTTTNWVAIPVAPTNRHLELPVSPEKYFRLIQ